MPPKQLEESPPSPLARVIGRAIGITYGLISLIYLGFWAVWDGYIFRRPGSAFWKHVDEGRLRAHRPSDALNADHMTSQPVKSIGTSPHLLSLLSLTTSTRWLPLANCTTSPTHPPLLPSTSTSSSSCMAGPTLAWSGDISSHSSRPRSLPPPSSSLQTCLAMAAQTRRTQTLAQKAF